MPQEELAATGTIEGSPKIVSVIDYERKFRHSAFVRVEVCPRPAGLSHADCHSPRMHALFAFDKIAALLRSSDQTPQPASCPGSAA